MRRKRYADVPGRRLPDMANVAPERGRGTRDRRRDGRTDERRRTRDVRVRYGPKSAAEAAAVGGAFGGALKTRRGGGGSSDGGDEGALLR